MNKKILKIVLIALSIGIITSLLIYKVANAVSVLTVQQGGTSVGTVTGIIKGNGTSAFSGLTTSAGIAGAISDETGSGALVFGTSPTISTGLTLGFITGSTQCLHVNTSGVVSGTSSDCGTGSGGASTALDNLSSVAINASLVLGTSDAFALGSTTKQWGDLFLAEGGVINWDNGDVTLTQTGDTLNVAGGVLVVPANGLTINATNVTSTGTQLNYLNAATGTTGTTSTNLVFSTSPVLTTPTLGVASATSLATSAASPLLLTNGQLVTVALTSQTVGGATLTIPDFASVSDEFTFKTKSQTLSNKTFVAPVLGAATATSINKITLTQPASGATLTLIDGKTLTVNKTISFTAADDTGVYTLPTGTKTLLATDGAGTSLTGIPYTITGTANQVIASAGTGNITLSLPQSIGTGSSPQFAGLELSHASANTLTASGGILSIESVAIPTISSSDTLTNKTLTTPVINGAITGTGQASAATASTIMMRDANANSAINNLVSGFTTTATAAGTTTMTIASTGTQVWTGSTTQTIKLPTTSVLQGQQYQIINQSTGLVTVQSSGANTITILGANTSSLFTAVVATPTTAANWASLYLGDIVASGKSLSVSNTLTLAGTDATTMTFPTTSATIARTDAANTFTGHQTIEGVTSTGATGTGKLVFDGTPTLVTPALGAATYTTLVGGNITDSGLTSGRLTIAGASGILADDSDLTFSTDTLTATKIGATTLAGTATLAENSSIALDPAGSADGKYSGTTVTGTGGATIAFGDLVTLDKDDSRWELVDISVAAAATGDARGIIGIAVTSSSDGAAITVLLNGIIRADANFPALTIGASVYATTAGDIVVAQPSTVDYVIRVIGFALTADEIYFNPSNDYITHT